MNTMSRMSVWQPFGNDRAADEANEIAQGALQLAVRYDAARRRYSDLPPRRLDAEARQRCEVEDLGAEIDAEAARAGYDSAVFRDTLARRLRNDHGRSFDLSSLPPRAHRYDDDRRMHLGRKLDTHARHEEAQRLLARAEKRTAACACTKLLALRRRQAETASDEYQRARDALAEYDRADGAAE